MHEQCAALCPIAMLPCALHALYIPQQPNTILLLLHPFELTFPQQPFKALYPIATLNEPDDSLEADLPNTTLYAPVQPSIPA